LPPWNRKNVRSGLAHFARPRDGVWDDGGMSRDETVYRCQACGVERIGPGIDLAGTRNPCANDGCGSVDLDVVVVIEDEVLSRDLLRGKLKDPAIRARQGRKADVIIGSEYFRRDGRWHRVERSIDYTDDRYDETIIDETTGAVVHECHERLSDHQGRGSASWPAGDR
jgi:hypothetical protein